MAFKVFGAGRLTADPELRYSQGTNQTAVAKFSLAADRKFKKDGKPVADFFDCTVFGKQAEFVAKYFKKGNKMIVNGELQNDNYTDKNGVKRYNTQIIVDEIEFAESKKAEDQPTAKPATQQAAPIKDEDEIPFN